jgi:hypothetical protein
MSDKSEWSVTCLNGGCDFSKSGSNDAVSKAAQAHVDGTGHATMTENIVGGTGVVSGAEAAAPAKVIDEPAKTPAKKTAAGKVGA